MRPPTAARDAATAALRELILAGERYRIAVASHLDLTVNESRAISHLLARGPMGQTDLATALGLDDELDDDARRPAGGARDGRAGPPP